jgi:hypothetical protein
MKIEKKDLKPKFTSPLTRESFRVVVEKKVLNNPRDRTK